MRKKHMRTVFVAVGLTVGVSLGCGTTAFAVSHADTAHHQAAKNSVAKQPQTASQKLPTNSSGLTYGTIAPPMGTSDAGWQTPDLVAVVASNGETGYVYSSELLSTDGLADSPKDALAAQAAALNGGSSSLTVYAVDGKTVIGHMNPSSAMPPGG